MAKATKQQQSKKIVAEAQDEITGQASGSAETPTGRVKEGFRPAYHTYHAYLEARKGLEEAFKQRERQDQEASRESERRHQLCEQAIDLANRVREKAKRDAQAVYGEDVDKAIYKALYEAFRPTRTG